MFFSNLFFASLKKFSFAIVKLKKLKNRIIPIIMEQYIFVWFATGIGFLYKLPQMYKLYTTRNYSLLPPINSSKYKNRLIISKYNVIAANT